MTSIIPPQLRVFLGVLHASRRQHTALPPMPVRALAKRGRTPHCGLRRGLGLERGKKLGDPFTFAHVYPWRRMSSNNNLYIPAAFPRLLCLASATRPAISHSHFGGRCEGSHIQRRLDLQCSPVLSAPCIGGQAKQQKAHWLPCQCVFDAGVTCIGSKIL